jgi:hypothetical protein
MEDAMERQFNETTDGLIEVAFETLIALATAAAICVGLVSLAAQLDAARTARAAAAAPAHHAAAMAPSAGARLAAAPASQLN